MHNFQAPTKIRYSNKHYETFENLRDDVSNSLENKILPFLNTIQEYQNVKDLFSDENIQKLIKFDSIRALQLACFYYLIGEKNEGIQLVESIITNSKNRYEFAEKILERMKC